MSACPGSAIERAHPKREIEPEHYRITPFYEPSEAINVSPEDADVTLAKMQTFDAAAEVFVVIAHDRDLKDILPFHPRKINDWDRLGYKALGRWRFLKDFLKTVQGKVKKI